MIEPPTQAASCSPGSLRIATGAALFACTNAAATALYRRGGASVVSLYVIRSPIVYVANVLLVALQEGRPAATNVLLLRTGSATATRLALTRSLLNSLKQILLSIAFVYLTYADAFTVFKGVGVLSTALVARALLGAGERLSARELACGGLVLLGITLIAQPPALFDNAALLDHAWVPHLWLPRVDREWVPRVGAGLALAATAGGLSAFSGALMRLLSQAGGPHDGHTPPAMLLSFLSVTMFACNGGAHLAARLAGLTEAPAWAPTAFVCPSGSVDWLLIGVNCACTLAAHLATAAGYRDMRAGMVAFLQLTELPWVYLLDVLALGEPTSLLASVGSAVVFAGAVAAALQHGKP